MGLSVYKADTQMPSISRYSGYDPVPIKKRQKILLDKSIELTH